MDTTDTDAVTEPTPDSILESLREAYADKTGNRYWIFAQLKEIVDDPYEYAEREDPAPLMTTLYLLAGWRETAVYPALAHLIRYPMSVLNRIFAAQAFEDLSRILASVYDGNPEPLKAVIEDEDAEVDMRVEALHTLYVLQCSGRLTSAELKEYLRHLLNGGLARKPSYLWESLMLQVGMLPAPELFPDVYRAYDAGLMVGGVIPLSVLNDGLGDASPVTPDDCTLIDDPIAEIGAWMRSAAEQTSNPSSARSVHTGRNDPCPCGSGSKFKKCCGRN
jgi:hypothetical protein